MAVVLVVGVAVAVWPRDAAPSAAPSHTAAASDAPSVTPTPRATSTSAGSAPPAAPTPEAPNAQTALAALNALAEAPAFSPYAYDRDLFGQAWADVDRNGCDTRNDILARDLLNPVFKEGTNNCKVLSGELLDPYDGRAVTFVSGTNTSAEVQIDHVVALAWAWHHGAFAWTTEQRTTFANDPLNLLATSGQVNQSKSSSGPAGWLPPQEDLRCRYVERWVSVLERYGLGIHSDDRDAARAVLETC